MHFLKYTDKLLELSEQLFVYINFNKYHISQNISHFLDNLTPSTTDSTLIYYKNLHKFYEYIKDTETDYGFGTNILKLAQERVKKDNTNYVDITTLHKKK